MAPQLTIPESFTRLGVPVPPDLERVLGYEGEHRFVGFFWQPAGDEFRQADGSMECDGHWHAWQAYSHHGLVWALLYGLNPDDWFERSQQYDYGSSEADAQHMFLLDREQRAAYAAPVADARQFLRAQIPMPTAQRPALVLTDAEWIELGKRITAVIREWTPPTSTEIREQMDREFAAIQAMEAWLNSEVSHE